MRSSDCQTPCCRPINDVNVTDLYRATCDIIIIIVVSSKQRHLGHDPPRRPNVGWRIDTLSRWTFFLLQVSPRYFSSLLARDIAASYTHFTPYSHWGGQRPQFFTYYNTDAHFHLVIKHICSSIKDTVDPAILATKHLCNLLIKCIGPFRHSDSNLRPHICEATVLLMGPTAISFPSTTLFSHLRSSLQRKCLGRLRNSRKWEITEISHCECLFKCTVPCDKTWSAKSIPRR